MLKLTGGALTAIIALGTTLAMASDTALQGQTVKVASERGETTYVFNEDGTFKSTGAAAGEGLWHVEGTKVCVQPSGGQKECEIEAKDANPGDTWQQSFKGAQATVTIVQ